MQKRRRGFKIYLVVFLMLIICFVIIESKNSNAEKVELNKSDKLDSTETMTNTINQNINSQNLILVNKNNPIKSNYEPNDLVVPSIRFQRVGDGMVKYVRTDATIALEKLFKAAKKDGINLLAISGYRSYAYQETVYKNEVNNVGETQANRYVAKPGESEHQTGLAMDVLADEYRTLDEGFENTESFRWLQNNMSKFGFILRFPKGKENITGYAYEPWHIRYVGEEASTEIMKKGLTLEEYINKN
ncbi:M15 family metallopeptidase [Clostridium sp. MB05]|uniref:M15 family metallopeptidase n=1 Tax=Clostridium sp. MB05 TaxID=3376682 RepID=UPI003982462D